MSETTAIVSQHSDNVSEVKNANERLQQSIRDLNLRLKSKKSNASILSIVQGYPCYTKEEEAELYRQNLLVQKLEETIERLERQLADYEQELYENDHNIRGGSI